MELNGGDECAALGVYCKPLSSTLENRYMVNFVSSEFRKI